jgi:twitching motility protein PilI
VTEVNAGIEAGAALFQKLRDIEIRCVEHAAGLPQREILETTWEGVLFSVGGHPLIAPLGEVKEIINYTADITPVPGTRSWLLGVANVRGNLLPVVDLQAYLLGRSTVSGRRSRVLVIDHNGVYSGLLVDQMVGIRHFRASEQTSQSVPLPEPIARFVERYFDHDREIWPVFSMLRLAENSEFLLAAA